MKQNKKSRNTVIAGSNVDVEALFGAQATKQTKKANGNRLAPRQHSLTHGDSFASSVKHGEGGRGLSPAVIAEHELERMRVAEMEQSRTDGFWGLDKENFDKCVEQGKCATNVTLRYSLTITLLYSINHYNHVQ